VSDEENAHGKSRLDRLEEFTETLLQEHISFAGEHKKLLTGQVVLNDQLQSLSALQKDLAESQKHTDDRMNALIGVVDDLIRKRPQ